ncbi:MAG TPA: NTP transferase domain-containing protein [Sphingobium sp.]|nr:NTP transferase domain-containing protein [Sphingobium sp.]
MNRTVLILAGSRPEGDPLAAHEGLPAKALIPLHGPPMLARVVAAVRAAGENAIMVSASQPTVTALACSLGCAVAPARDGPSESAAEAFRQCGAPMLLTTADHALLDPQWVRHLIASHPPGADISVLLARRETIEQAAPGTRRTYLRFADGQWSGCNLFYLATPAAGAALDFWRQVERDRKRPWRIAARLGPGLLWRYWLGRLTVHDAIVRLGQRAGLRAAVVESPFGLAAIDVDSPADLALVRTLIARREAAHSAPAQSPETAPPAPRPAAR